MTATTYAPDNGASAATTVRDAEREHQERVGRGKLPIGAAMVFRPAQSEHNKCSDHNKYWRGRNAVIARLPGSQIVRTQ